MASRVDLNGIKTELKSLFDTANTTTASPIDLSSNLSNSKRVNKVLTIHPEMILPQASLFPLVTCYIDSKTIKRLDIANSAPKHIIMGRHLLELGMHPGKQVGELLHRCYQEQLEGRITTLEEGIAFVKKVLAEQ